MQNEDKILSLLYEIRKGQSILMAKITDLDQMLTMMNDVTNKMSGNVKKVIDNETIQLKTIQDLKDQIAKGGTIKEADLDPLLTRGNAIKDALVAASTSLEAIATDPENPFPTP